MKYILLLLALMVSYLESCSNKPVNPRLRHQEQVIDSIIAGYDSKDIEVYKNAQHRIAESFILYDILKDSLLSSKDKDYLATKLDQAESIWYKHDNNTFFKTTFITDESKVVEQVNIQYMGSDETDSIAVMKIWVPEEVDSIYLTLANWEIDSVKDIYSSSPMPLERGCFLSRLKPYNQEMLLQRNTLFIDGYTAKDDSLYLHVAIPLHLLHEQLSNNETFDSKNSEYD
ncbi:MULTISPECIES: hypothetical protein [Bacteroidales]|uniref:hypothetical protein n=1 Tax=Bacteroidales TaxID=171549 RepID=UPI0022E244B3|nr:MULTISPECIES: hypothetical protein [Bacteroidales]